MPAISKHTGHASMAFRLLENPGEDMDGRIGRRASESAGGARPKGESLTEGWPDIPAPIMAERARQSPYPEDAFPPDLEDLLQAVQRLAQCPAAIAGAALLGALALLAQHDFKVETLAPHLSPPSLFLVALAGSGLHKTTAFTLLESGHEEADRRLATWWNEAKASYDERRA